MKKKASVRSAKATSRQSTLNFPASSEADLVAESTAAETSMKSGAKNRRKRTADFADDADKPNKAHCDSSAISAQSAVKNSSLNFDPAPASAMLQGDDASTLTKSSVKNRRKRTADFADKTNESPCDSSAISAQSAVKNSITDPSHETESLRNGWRWMKAHEVGEINLGRQRSPKHRSAEFPTKYLRAANITETGLDLSDVLEMDFKPAQKERYQLRAGDILISEASGSAAQVGKPAIWNDELPMCCFQNTLIRLRPNAVSSKYLLWLFTHFYRNGVFARVAGGVGINHLSASKFSELSLPIAPPAEQHRIVAEIEKQFTRLDAGVAALKRVQANLKRYRAAVLKAACEGKLVPTEAEMRRTADYADIADKKLPPSASSAKSAVKTPPFETGEQLLQRILTERRQNWQGRGEYKEPAEPDTTNLPSIPEGWGTISLDQLSAIITSGSRDWTQFYGRGTGTFVMAQNVRPGKLDLSYKLPVGPPHDNRDRIRSEIARNDLLVTIVGANTGDVCRVPEQLTQHYVCQSVALIRPVVPETSKYIELYLISPENGRKQFDRYIYGAGRPHLSFDQIKMAVITLPPLAEQTRIVAEVERQLSVVEELEAVVSANLQRAARLRQSILQKAFTGELTGDATCDHGLQVQQRRN